MVAILVRLQGEFLPGCSYDDIRSNWSREYRLSQVYKSVHFLTNKPKNRKCHDCQNTDVYEITLARRISYILVMPYQIVPEETRQNGVDSITIQEWNPYT